MNFLKKEVNHLVGKAIHRYALLDNNDRILAGISGGADSLILLHFLRIWQKKAPIHFDIIPVYLDMGFDNGATKKVLEKYFNDLKIPCYIEETDFGSFAHGSLNRGKSPCFLCSWNRRKRLFELTKVLNCNKIALGHNLDDLIETFFMNICFSGETSTMTPRQDMFKGLITIIRPLALVEKEKIARLARQLGLPVCKNECPSSQATNRARIRKILDEMYRLNKKVKGNIKNALSNVKPEYLLS